MTHFLRVSKNWVLHNYNFLLSEKEPVHLLTFSKETVTIEKGGVAI